MFIYCILIHNKLIIYGFKSVTLTTLTAGKAYYHMYKVYINVVIYNVLHVSFIMLRYLNININEIHYHLDMTSSIQNIR